MTMNPSTRLSRRSSIAAVSASTSSSELARMRSNPAACATSEIPRVARAKKGHVCRGLVAEQSGLWHTEEGFVAPPV